MSPGTVQTSRPTTEGNGDITARFLGSLTSIGTSDYELSIYGRDATVSVVGSGNDKRLRVRERTSQDWRELSAPSPEEGTWSPALSAEQNNWNVIFGRLVADIAGQPHAYYPTFEAGLTASILIDAIRSEGWTRT